MCLSLLAAHLFANVSHKIHVKVICDVEVTLDKERKIIGYMTRGTSSTLACLSNSLVCSFLSKRIKNIICEFIYVGTVL
jgi:hypothetical protein